MRWNGPLSGVLATATVLMSLTITLAQPDRPPADNAALVDSLRSGGYVLFMRHGAREEITSPESRGSCELEANLTDEGRAQARAVGQAFQALAIPVGQVLSSDFCRTLETAQLAFGRAEPLPALREIRPDLAEEEREARVAGIRELLSVPPTDATNSILVSHAMIFRAAVDLGGLEPAETAIFEPDGHGGFTLVARVRWDEWTP